MVSVQPSSYTGCGRLLSTRDALELHKAIASRCLTASQVKMKERVFLILLQKHYLCHERSNFYFSFPQEPSGILTFQVLSSNFQSESGGTGLPLAVVKTLSLSLKDLNLFKIL